MKPLPIVLAVLAVAVIAAVAYLLYEPTLVPEANGVVVDRSAGEPGNSRETALDAGPGDDTRASLDVEQQALPVQAELPEATMPESYRAALGGVIGRVVEESGEPVADFTLTLMGGGVADVLSPLDGLARGVNPELQLELGTARTDVEGRFRFDDLEPRSLGLLLLDPGGPRAGLHLLEETPVSGALRDLGDIVLPGSVTFVGQVVNISNQPLPGVRVRATDLMPLVLGSGVADWREGSALLVDTDEGGKRTQMVIEPPPSLARLERLLPFPTTLTDEDGRFELPGVRPGLASLVIDDGLHQTKVEGPLPTGEAGSLRDVGSLTLLDGLSLRGRVIDAKGKPVPHAEVMAGNSMSFGPVTILHPAVRADEDGRFEVRGLREGTARAVARADAQAGFSPDEGSVPAGGETTVVLPGRRSLTLALRDEDQQPLEQARFFARRLPVEDAVETPDFLLPPKERGGEQDVTRDEQGRFVIADLNPGFWDVLITSEGYGPVRTQFDLTLDDLEQELVLKHSLGLSVRVTRESDGEPLEWVSVSARNLDREDRGMPQPVTAERTDEQGRARLDDLEPGHYALELAHPAYAVRVVETELPLPAEQAGEATEGQPAELALSLTRGGTILGSVVENGAPPARILMVTLSRSDDMKSSAVLPRMTLTTPDGHFSFHDVDPGEVELQARDRFELAGLTSWWEPFAMTPDAEQTVFVESEGELETVLVVGSSWADTPTGFVEGRLDVNGYPAAGWKVRTWGSIRRSVSTGPDGRFTMGQLAAGTVALSLSAPGQAMMAGAVDSVSFELAEGDRHFEPISLHTGSVEGRVRSAIDGRPVKGAQISLQSVDEKAKNGWFGRRGSTAASDEAGLFAFNIVSEGSYAVRAEAQGFATARSDTFHVSGQRPTRGVELTLAAPVTIKGHVVFEELEQEPSWAWLNATTEHGDRSGARVDMESGSFVFDDLLPDQTWTVSAYTNNGEEIQPVELYVRGDRDDVALVFRPKAPEPEEDAFDGTEEQVEQLKDLGYVSDDGG